MNVCMYSRMKTSQQGKNGLVNMRFSANLCMQILPSFSRASPSSGRNQHDLKTTLIVYVWHAPSKHSAMYACSCAPLKKLPSSTIMYKKHEKKINTYFAAVQHYYTRTEQTNLRYEGGFNHQKQKSERLKRNFARIISIIM